MNFGFREKGYKVKKCCRVLYNLWYKIWSSNILNCGRLGEKVV